MTSNIKRPVTEAWQRARHNASVSELNIKQVRQQDASTNAECREYYAQHLSPLFQRQQKATFPSLTACLYLLNSRDRGWCLRQASKHNFGLLWPWSLTSWPPRSAIHALAPGGDLCQFALKSVHSFSKDSVHKLVTDERTDGRTDRRTDIQNCYNNNNNNNNTTTYKAP